MVGFGHSLTARSIGLIVFALAKFSASLATAMRRIQSRSAPAENATPCPVRTTIRVSLSAPSVLNASVSERMTVSSIALRTCGRLIATVALPRGSLATITEGPLISGASAVAGSQRGEFSRLHYLAQLANRHEAALKDYRQCHTIVMGIECNRSKPNQILGPTHDQRSERAVRSHQWRDARHHRRR